MEQKNWKELIDTSINNIKLTLVNNKKVSNEYFEIVKSLLQLKHCEDVSKIRNRERGLCGNFFCQEKVFLKKRFCGSSCVMKFQAVTNGLKEVSPYRRSNVEVLELLEFVCEFEKYDLKVEDLRKLYFDELNKNEIMKHDIVVEDEPQPVLETKNPVDGFDEDIDPSIFELPPEMEMFGTIWGNLSKFVTISTVAFMKNRGFTETMLKRMAEKKEKNRRQIDFEKQATKVLEKVSKFLGINETSKKTAVRRLVLEVISTFSFEDELFRAIEVQHTEIFIYIILDALKMQKILEKEGISLTKFDITEIVQEKFKIEEFKFHYFLNKIINGE